MRVDFFDRKSQRMLNGYSGILCHFIDCLNKRNFFIAIIMTLLSFVAFIIYMKTNEYRYFITMLVGIFYAMIQYYQAFSTSIFEELKIYNDERDDFWHMGLNTLTKTTSDPDTVAGGPKMPHCSEAWDAISRYIYTGLQGGSIMKDWMKEENTMIACCSDGTRPVIFKIERIDEK